MKCMDENHRCTAGALNYVNKTSRQIFCHITYSPRCAGNHADQESGKNALVALALGIAH